MKEAKTHLRVIADAAEEELLVEGDGGGVHALCLCGMGQGCESAVV